MTNNFATKERFYVLDIFRGIFASFVFIFHLSPFTSSVILNNNFFHHSDLFVDFFFILSGFVIALNYSEIGNTKDVLSFCKKRFRRIYPLHFVMLIAFLGIELVKAPLSTYVHVNKIANSHNTIESFFSSLLLLNSTPILNTNDVSWNIPSWSISAEMIAYVVFAFNVLVLIAAKKQFLKQFLPFGIVAVAIAILFYLTDKTKIDYTYDFGFLRGIIGFYTGVLTYHCYKMLKCKGFYELSQQTFSMLEILIIALVIITLICGNTLKPIGLIYELVFSLCILIFCSEKGIISSMLIRVNILKNLGKYSYSIYMTHAFVISLFNIVFIRLLKFPDSHYSYLFILNFILVYMIASWTYKNIEMRFYH